MNTYNACISAGRPQNVKLMEELCGTLHWYVPSDQRPLYLDAGAISVNRGDSLIEARNAALEVAFSIRAPCVQVSDDLKQLRKAVENDGEKVAESTTFQEAIDAMWWEASRSLAMLVGVAPTDNPFYWNPRPRTRKAKFIVGDLMLILPNPLRFDPQFKVREDYDMTCQHIAKYGTVGRADEILATFAHRTNAGGTVDWRTPEIDEEATRLLKAKWGRMIQDNARRPGEILLVT